MSEEKYLIKKAKEGDSEAFGKLYDIHLTPIYRFVFLRVSNKTDAEDITQQIFLKAWKNIEGFEYKQGAKFSSWLYRITRNTIIDHYRTSKEHIDIESISEHRFIEYKDKDDFIDEEMKMTSIMKAISKLNESDQELVIMKYIEDLPNGEIASLTDKSEGAVRVACHRALKRLKKEIEKNEQ